MLCGKYLFDIWYTLYVFPLGGDTLYGLIVHTASVIDIVMSVALYVRSFCLRGCIDGKTKR
jgi:hypothetical protein